MTEAYPTYDRHFWQTKILTAKDSMDNYREATAAERSAWATAHPDGNVVPERPEWAPLAEAAGAVRHDDRGYWSLNTLDDITDDEMLRIYEHKQEMSYLHPIDNGVNIRTNLMSQSTLASYDSAPDMSNFIRNEYIQVLCIKASEVGNYHVKPSSVYNMLYRAALLHTVIGILDMSSLPSGQSPFTHNGSYLPSLRTLKLKNLKSSMNIGGLKSISVESLQFWVDNSANGTTPITITVHGDVWTKLTAGSGFVNLIKGGNVANNKSDYCVALYRYDNLAHLVAGQKYRLTMCYKLGGKDDSLGASLSSGYGHSITEFNTSGGIVTESKIIEYNPSSNFPTGREITLSMYHRPNDADFDPETTVYWAVLTPLMDDEPTEWMPAISEIADADAQEQAQWTLTRQLAVARNISFAEATN